MVSKQFWLSHILDKKITLCQSLKSMFVFNVMCTCSSVLFLLQNMQKHQYLLKMKIWYVDVLVFSPITPVNQTCHLPRMLIALWRPQPWWTVHAAEWAAVPSRSQQVPVGSLEQGWAGERLSLQTLIWEMNVWRPGDVATFGHRAA